MIACRQDHVHVVEALLAHDDIEVDAQDGLGNTALMTSCAFGHLSSIRLLLAAGADKTLLNNAGKTANELVHTSIDVGKATVLKLLSD